MGLRERWRSSRPAFVVLLGGAVGIGGNAAWIVGLFLSGPGDLGALAACVLGIALSAASPLPVLRARTTARFLLAGLAASVVALLTWPGVVGGGLALAGAVWGILESLGHP